VIGIKGNLGKARKVGKAFIFMQMEIDMKVNGKTIKDMV
jgi:hypothetical protein